ncbi:tetratricopeptide repeat protein [Flavobacterium helocola]|uniref:Tetratricopeptide repeat protein n=1 Tax=Flavobacterium helocola TaxID=3139139 RepID=A0ABU9IAS8_9FLAO
MKKLIILSAVLIVLSSCKQKENNPNLSHHDLHPGCKHEEELGKVVDSFNLKLTPLYNSNLPANILIFKADSLIKDFNISKSQFRSEVSKMCQDQISYFKAEIFYKNGNFKESIKQINNSIGKYPYVFGDNATALAANYVKLKDYESAKSYIDSLRKGDYIYHYANAQYYECIKNKEKAIEFYQSIVNDSSKKRRFYFKIAQNRLKELNKNNVVFESEIIFPTMKPGSQTYLQ